MKSGSTERDEGGGGGVERRVLRLSSEGHTRPPLNLRDQERERKINRRELLSDMH